MNMFSVFVLALVSYLASAIPLLSRQSQTTNPFVIRASQPDSPIHLSSLNANDGHFWFGRATSSSCPAQSAPRCPTGTETAFVVSGNGRASLDANVPGGQVIYVAKDGALSFTPAHEENLTAIAYSSGFSYLNGAQTGGLMMGSFTFSETPSKGWLACPVTDNGPWQVYAFIKGANDTGCMDFEAAMEAYKGDAVWQYD